jgi:hypothetical protein
MLKKATDDVEIKGVVKFKASEDIEDYVIQVLAVINNKMYHLVSFVYHIEEDYLEFCFSMHQGTLMQFSTYIQKNPIPNGEKIHSY